MLWWWIFCKHFLKLFSLCMCVFCVGYRIQLPKFSVHFCACFCNAHSSILARNVTDDSYYCFQTSRVMVLYFTLATHSPTANNDTSQSTDLHVECNIQIKWHYTVCTMYICALRMGRTSAKGHLFRTFKSYWFIFNGRLCNGLIGFCLWLTPSPGSKQFLWFVKNYLLRFHRTFLLFDSSIYLCLSMN